VVFVPFGTQTTTMVAPKKQITLQNNKPKTAHTPSPSKPEVTRNTTVAAVNTPSPKNTDLKKVEAVAKIEPVKEIAKNEIKKENTPAKSVDNIQQKKTQDNLAKALDIEQKIMSVIPENAQISHNYREVEALRMQAQLQKEIVQTWKPPIGVSPDCSCDVSFFVTATGTLNHIKMVKPSGVMMFDISARQALCATKMPHWTYGKTLTITFKQ
jgi:outer membrane biosynthesis protein TonB